MTLLIKLTTIVFRLKINFVVVATTIIDIIVDKFNFVMMNMRFISIAINTRCIISKLKNALKIKNKRSIESLNENCIH